MAKTMHMCMSVRGFLSNSKFPRDFIRMFKRPDGTSLSPEEARDHLYDELAQGHEVIPLSGEPCPGFDYSGGGCPGHEVEEEKPPCLGISTCGGCDPNCPAK